MSLRYRYLFPGIMLAICSSPGAMSDTVPEQAKGPADKGKSAGKDQYGDPLPASTRARMGTVRFRHGGQVLFVGFSADGTSLTSMGLDMNVRRWEVASGKETRSFKLSGPGYTSTSISPDRKTLALIGVDQSIHLWDIEAGKDLRKFGGEQPVGGFNATFSWDSKLLAVVCNDQSIRAWEVASGKEILNVKPQQPMNGMAMFNANIIAFSPDNKVLAAGGIDGMNGAVMLYDVATGKEVRKLAGGQAAGMTGIAFTADGKTVGAITDGGQIIRLWDVASGKEQRQFTGVQNGFMTMAFSPDGKVMATGSYDKVRVWETATGKEIRQLGDLNTAFSSLSFSPDGKTLAAGSMTSMIQLWEVATGKTISLIGGHQAAITSLASSPDGKLLVTMGADQTVRVWDSATGKELRQLTAGKKQDNNENQGLNQFGITPRTTVMFAPDGKTVAASWQDGTIRRWEASTGKELPSFPGHPAGITSVVFAPSGKVIASTGLDGMARFWQLSTGKEVRKITITTQGSQDLAAMYGIPNGPNIITFSPDGKTLAMSGLDMSSGPVFDGSMTSSVRLLEVATGKERRKFKFQLAPGNMYGSYFGLVGGLGLGGVAFGGDFGFGGYGAAGGKSSMMYTPDGMSLALGTGNNIQLLDVIGGREIRRFGGNSISAGAMAISPDGRVLAAGSTDGNVFLWDMATGTTIAQADGHRGEVTTVGFSADGKLLFSGGSDTTALVWDMAKLTEPLVRPENLLSAKDLEVLWNELGGDDAEKAYTAINRLALASKVAVPFLQERIRSAVPVEAERLAKLITDLDDKRFSVRQKASEELERLGDLAEPALQQVLEKQPSLEMRKRVEQLLAKLEGPITLPEQLREQRALEVLEQSGTPEARIMLEKLAKGADGSRLTQEARSALQRIGGKGKPATP